MMDKEMLKALKGKSREEKAAYLKEHKIELKDDALAAAGGGYDIPEGNPDSEVPDANNNYISSWGYVCEGEVMC